MALVDVDVGLEIFSYNKKNQTLAHEGIHDSLYLSCINIDGDSQEKEREAKGMCRLLEAECVHSEGSFSVAFHYFATGGNRRSC